MQRYNTVFNVFVETQATIDMEKAMAVGTNVMVITKRSVVDVGTTRFMK